MLLNGGGVGGDAGGGGTTPKRRGSKVNANLRRPKIFEEAKDELGELLVIVKTGSLHTPMKGIDPKLQCSVRVETGLGETEPKSGTEQVWNTEFRFPVAEYFPEVEVSLNTSRVDLVTQETRWIKEAGLTIELDLMELLRKGEADEKALKLVGRRGKHIADVTISLEYLQKPNLFEGMEKMLLSEKQELVTAIFKSYKSDDSLSTLPKSLLLLSWFNGNEMPLLKLAIRHEVETAENTIQLLRGETLPVKVLSEYLKVVGEPYLLQTLTPLIRPLATANQRCEVDPGKSSTPLLEKDLKKNQKNLNKTAGKFLKAIVGSASRLPSDLADLCRFLSEQVQSRFPDAQNLALGAIIFLRFVCPAIVSPESYGIVGEGDCKPPTRRFLILVTKILQNLVNEVTFGEKEEYMVCMNPFLAKHGSKMSDFYDKVLKIKPETTLDNAAIMRRVPDKIYLDVFQYINNHCDTVCSGLPDDLSERLRTIVSELQEVSARLAQTIADQEEAERLRKEEEKQKAAAEGGDRKLKSSKQQSGDEGSAKDGAQSGLSESESGIASGTESESGLSSSLSSSIAEEAAAGAVSSEGEGSGVNASFGEGSAGGESASEGGAESAENISADTKRGKGKHSKHKNSPKTKPPKKKADAKGVIAMTFG
ncbi:Ras GTPase activating protein ira2 [Balamuthia mandrillaris]